MPSRTSCEATTEKQSGARGPILSNLRPRTTTHTREVIVKSAPFSTPFALHCYLPLALLYLFLSTSSTTACLSNIRDVLETPSRPLRPSFGRPNCESLVYDAPNGEADVVNRIESAIRGAAYRRCPGYSHRPSSTGLELSFLDHAEGCTLLPCFIHGHYACSFISDYLRKTLDVKRDAKQTQRLLERLRKTCRHQLPIRCKHSTSVSSAIGTSRTESDSSSARSLGQR